jgi:NF-X1-type zinc finger protein NFXL1
MPPRCGPAAGSRCFCCFCCQLRVENNAVGFNAPPLGTTPSVFLPAAAGPCPPCPRGVSTSCHCGAVVTDKRCGHHEFSCGGTCGALLACGHTCPAACHDGDCPPCGLVSEVSCRCGAQAEQLPCSQKGVYQVRKVPPGSGPGCLALESGSWGIILSLVHLLQCIWRISSWMCTVSCTPLAPALDSLPLQCTRVCGKLLDCGRHRCSEVCHSGPCGGCELAGPKACPCGKQQLPRAACDVVVPPCGETCGKLLSCGVHTCHERCHTGPCTTVCREQGEKSCECGKTTRSVQCQETFRCERRCANMRSCGRHPCRRRCCDGVNCPPCDEACNRWLKCRNHR